MPALRSGRKMSDQGLSGVGGSESTRNSGEHSRALRNQVQEDTTAVNYDGGIIVAEEGKRYLVLLPGSGMRVDKLDSIEGLRKQTDDKYEKKLAPPSHAKNMRERVETAMKEKKENINSTKDVAKYFAKHLQKVRKSNLFGLRVIWRLEFRDGVQEVGLNCGKMDHDQICRRLNIDSFHDLLSDQQPQSNAAPAVSVETQNRMDDIQQTSVAPIQAEDRMEIGSRPATPPVSDIKKESQGKEKSAGLAHPNSVESEVKDDATVYEERQTYIEETGRVIIAETTCKYNGETKYVLVQEADKVRVLEDTDKTKDYEYSFATETETDDFAPALHLNSLLSLAEGLDAFRASVLGIRRAENGFSRPDLDVWLFKTRYHSTELRCDRANGAQLLNQLEVNEFDTLMALCNIAPAQSKSRRITHQNDTPPSSQRSSPQYTPRVRNDSVLPSTESATPTTTRTTNTHPASDPNNDEYHLIAMHLPMVNQEPKYNTPCIVKGGPHQYELWKWKDVKSRASVKDCPRDQQFHAPDKKMVDYIGNKLGFNNPNCEVITVLTQMRGTNSFVNTVMISVNDKVTWEAALKLRENDNKGPLQCCISDYQKYKGEYSVAMEHLQDTQDARDFLIYRKAKDDAKRSESRLKSRSKSRGLTPQHADREELLRKVREEAIEEVREEVREECEELREKIEDLERQLSSRVADIENKLAETRVT
jgi:hypothetical protein